MKLRVKPELKDLESYKPGKPASELKRELGLKKVIKLASNENPYRPPRRVLEALRRAILEVNRYPDSSCYHLREKLSRRYGVEGNRIIFGNGSDELVTLALRALLDKGDEVLMAYPTFLIYHIASKAAGLRIRRVPLKNYRYDLDAMAGAVTPTTKLIFIANPDNPTGTYVTRGEVERFLDEVPEDVIIFFDEAYFEYARDLGDYPDSLRYHDGKGNIITARTFSKAYGIAGLRVGYAIAEPSIIELMNKVRSPFNVNSLAQIAAEAALDEEEYVKRVVEKTEKGKRQLYEGLKDLGLEYIPSAANFVLIRLGGGAAAIAQELMMKGIITRYMGPWGLPEHIRVTVGTEEENRVFLKALGESIKVLR
ncbi:MAG: histidinol-phosphate transaminase [Candidatus Bathyarchaeia archaeon]|nr:histidinol-phosphate transaminase [Candidatus Bathyarchaeota archaeon]